jgi:hypothetical protein
MREKREEMIWKEERRGNRMTSDRVEGLDTMRCCGI